jgi:hypothetical protein
MSEVPRRTLEEVVAQYELEPTLRDVYVEGPIDVKVIRTFLDAYDAVHVNVYDIDCVNISAEMLRANGFSPPDRRGSVITLAIYLETNVANLPEGATCATCIIDRDLDSYFERSYSSSHLLVTDFCSMECYALTLHHIGKILRFYDYRQAAHYVSLFKSIANVLMQVHCHRVANAKLRWGLRGLNLSDFVSVSNGIVKYDSDEHTTRLLNKNARIHDRSEYELALADAAAKLTSDARHHANGHDLLELVAWVLVAVGCIKASRIDAVRQSLLYIAIDFRTLTDFPLFRALLTRLSST